MALLLLGDGLRSCWMLGKITFGAAVQPVLAVDGAQQRPRQEARQQHARLAAHRPQRCAVHRDDGRVPIPASSACSSVL